VRSMTSSKTIRQERIFSECANEVAAVLKCLVLGEDGVMEAWKKGKNSACGGHIASSHPLGLTPPRR
jgi:hypothetical protein